MADKTRLQEDTVEVPTPEDYKIAEKMVHDNPGLTAPPTHILLEQEKKAPNFGNATNISQADNCCCGKSGNSCGEKGK